MAYETIDEYIDHAPENVRNILGGIRQSTHAIAPEGVEATGKSIPAL